MKRIIEKRNMKQIENLKVQGPESKMKKLKLLRETSKLQNPRLTLKIEQSKREAKFM